MNKQDILGAEEELKEYVEYEAAEDAAKPTYQGPGLKEILLTPTGEGEVADYINHPMNFDKSEGMAQVLRGLTGLVGVDLALAVLDIVIGAFKWRKGVGANG